MIQELKIKNFLSFKDEVTISFEATKDKRLEDYHVVEIAKDVRLLKLGIVYGANASGKTNLINAFEYLRDFWFKVAESKEEETGVIPFLLDAKTKQNPSSFNLIFFADSIKYSYHLELTEKNVLYEKLEYYPSFQPAVVFERKYNGSVSEIAFGPKIKTSSITKEEISIKCLSNMSFFAAYNQVNTQINEIEKALHWIQNQFMPSIEPGTSLFGYSGHLIAENKAIKNKMLNFLQQADLNISEVNSEIIKEEVSDEFINQVKALNIPQIELERLQKDRSIKRVKITFMHNVEDEKGNLSKFPLDIELQSDGTKRVFGLAGAIFSTINENGFLAIDEIESKLHPDLLAFVLEQFLRESKGAQLLVSTHYDCLLDEDDLLRKDCIWFTEKKKDASTALYPLSDFTGLNRLSSLQKAYRVGKFGAIPDIN
jgi:hypothetical protein